MKSRLMFLVGLLAYSLTQAVFAANSNTTPGLKTGATFVINAVSTEGGASTKACAAYNKLMGTFVTTSLPAVIHAASQYPIFINGKPVTMMTDNGWGAPYFLYGSQLKINRVMMNQVFIIFADSKRTVASQLVMRAAPTDGTTNGVCRIVGEVQ